jgi:hypothetical protein
MINLKVLSISGKGGNKEAHMVSALRSDGLNTCAHTLTASSIFVIVTPKLGVTKEITS